MRVGNISYFATTSYLQGLSSIRV